MKKLILSGAIALMATATWAQNKTEDFGNQEVNFTIGQGGSLCCGEEHNDKQIDHLGDFESWSPTFSLTYLRYINPRLGLGARVAYMHWTDECQERSTPWNGISNNARHNCYQLMPTIKYYWLQKTHFGLYSEASVGFGLNHQKQTFHGTTDKVYIDPAWGLTFVGIDFGGQHLRGLVDIGIGQAAVLAAGISYRW